ncbi:MAG: phosphodiester glycosidase family protein, partial [Candidatus Ornithomonoglobus sp.]
MIKYSILKKLTAIAGAAVITVTGIHAFASILGTETSDSWTTDMGGGATYYHKVFDSPSVGKQTENYVEYKPNTEAVPVVVNGASVWGKRTITSAADYMKKNNMRPLIGINADYFSLTTGIPMGYTIIDGQIFSKEAGVQDAVGFRKDGTAFIDKIGIDASLSKDGSKVTVQYINKWSQDGLNGLYMLTDDFADTTHTNYKALFAICTPTQGNLTLNSTMTLTVDEVYIYDGDIAIPDGKVVFVMDPDGNADCVSLLSSLAPGDTVTFANSVYGAQRYNWEQAEFATSSIGGRLLNNGIIGSGFEAGAAPRTAVGVKDDGTVVFYTLDGRQSGYSYGSQITTLAKRMQELGCIDAINLDGGGSTAIGGVFPGSEIFTVTNRPSDGTLRSCANYLFLRDMRAQTGIPWYVEWRELPNRNYLAGTSVQLEAVSVY